MQLYINKKKWLGRQSFFVQMIVLAMIFFVASVIGVLIADYFFGDPSFGQGTTKEVMKFFVVKFIKAVIGATVLVFLIRGNPKKYLK